MRRNNFNMAIKQITAILALTLSFQGLVSFAQSPGGLFVRNARVIDNVPQQAGFSGYGVAISDSIAVIGSPGTGNVIGRASIFRRSLANNWVYEASIVAPDNSLGDQFGYSVAISGDTIVVGAYFANNTGATDSGAAYVFVYNGANWVAQEKLSSPDAFQGDRCGESVSISGETIAIGCRGDDVTHDDQGSVYIWVRNGGVWTMQQKLVASDGAYSDYLGLSVSLRSSTLIAGAPAKDSIAGTGVGAAYVFSRSGTVWTQQAKLTATDGEQADYFGYSVDLSLSVTGSTAVIGSRLDDIAGNENVGSAYVFSRPSAGIWTQTQKLTFPDGGVTQTFGSRVAISPTSLERIVVTAQETAAAKAVVYQRVDSVWTIAQVINKPSPTTNSNFGCSLDLSGDTMVVGAFNEPNPGANQSGAAYFYDQRPTNFDMDGDERSDLAIFRPSNGQWWINRSGTNTTFAATFGSSTDQITPADLTGDGVTDVALFRPSNGTWFVLRSEDSTFYAFPFGTNGDRPVAGDFDGDFIADAAVFRPSAATWYISRSTGGTTIQQFGAANDIPAIADYDADGRSDIGVFRPNGTNGAEWWLQRSRDASVIAFQFGAATDKPVPGDFTGDGKADVAFWRPSNGNWFVLRSQDNSFYAFPFGSNGDIPAPADYDGDAVFDAAVFRPSNATWYLNRSTSGTLFQQFGANGDRPVPSAYVP